MKNKTFKKSLSVFLSVLMILSCWVFAPVEHNHALAATYDGWSKEVTGYVTMDPVIYVHGAYSGDSNSEYAYMMDGSYIADATVTGEMSTAVSVSEKTISTINVVGGSDYSLSVSDGKLTGNLGTGYSLTQTDSKAVTLKFTFTDDTYEYHRVSVLPNPVAQHVYTLAYRYKKNVRIASLLATAVGSTGSNGGKGSDSWKSGNGNFPFIYEPAKNKDQYGVQNDGNADSGNGASFYDGFNYSVNQDKISAQRIAGTYLADRANDDDLTVIMNKARYNIGNNATDIVSPTATYYLDLSSDYHAGSSYDKTNKTFSFQVLSGPAYIRVSSSTSDSPMQLTANPTLWDTNGGAQTVDVATGQTDSGAYTPSSQKSFTNTISISGLSVGTISGRLAMVVQHKSTKKTQHATAGVDLPYQIKVVDNSSLRSVYNNYISQKLFGDKYYSGWEEYTNALEKAELWLSCNADTQSALLSGETQDTIKTELENAYNNLKEKVFDVNYENLFSFSEWAMSSCTTLNDRAANGAGTLSYDLNAGTVTVTGNDDIYTTYHGNNSAYYTMPVTYGKEYTFRYDVNSTGGGTKQAFVFFYDNDGKGVTGATYNGVAQTTPHIGVYDGSSITFTVPNGCTKIAVRFGVTVGSETTTATYSNIAVYETSREKATEAGLNEWDSRTYRTAYAYDAALNASAYTPTRTGYTFSGWTCDDSSYDDDVAMKKCYNLTSNWTEHTYTIKYDGNGATSGSITDKTGVKYTDEVQLEAASTFTKAGYTALGWNTDKNATTASYASKAKVSKLTADNNGVVTLYVIWKANSNTAYKVKHYQQNLADDDYTLYEEETTYTGTTDTQTAAVVKTYDGFTAQTIEQKNIAGDGSTVVKIYYTRNNYAVTFNYYSGTELKTETATYKYGATVTAPTDTDTNRTGYTFKSWSPTLAIVTGAATYIAQYDVNEYEVKYDANGGSFANGNDKKYTKVEYGATISAWNEPPTKQCYTFAGWDFGGYTTMPAKDITIKAKWTQNDVDNTSHNWIADDSQTSTSASCTEGGTSYQKCEYCGLTRTVTTAATGHDFTAETATATYLKSAATCTAKAVYYKSCSKCGASSKGTEKEDTFTSGTANGHDWSTTFTMESDGKDGKHYQTCTVCKENNTSVAHVFDGGEQTKAPTCTDKGETTYKCACGATYTADIDANGHTTTKTDAKPADCTNDGNIEYWYCSVCGKYFSDEACTKAIELKDTVIKASGHEFTKETATATYLKSAATCTAKAVYYKSCSKCSLSSKDQTGEVTFENGDALGHDWDGGEVLDGDAATCLKEGKTTFTCSRCSDIKTEPITQLNHRYIGKIKSNGDGKENTHSFKCVNGCEQYGGAVAHDWNEGEITTPASYTEEGVKTYTCKSAGCGATYTEPVAKLTDATAPTGTIEVGESKWSEFLTAITFGLYKNDDLNVTITAEDDQTDIKSIEYYVSDEALTLDQVKAIDAWTTYNKAFTIAKVDAKKKVIYAKLTNGQDLVTYISTNGFTFDTTAPVITVDVKCTSATITVTDDNLDTVTVGGANVTLDGGKYTIDGEGTYAVVAKDLAGNETTQTVEVKGHTYGKWIDENPADCENEGTKGHYTCSVCEKNFDADKNELTDLTIEAKGHTYGDWIAEDPADCENAGTKGHYTCSVCEKNFDADKNELTDLTIEAKGHTYGDWIAEDPADCENAGTKGHYTCSVCEKNFDTDKNELADLVIEAKGHTYGDWIAEDPADCENAGTKGHYTCSVCEKNFDADKNELTDLVIKANGHTYGDWIAEDPADCENAGTKGHYTCSVCEKNFDTDKNELADLVIEAKGHTYGDWIAEDPADCENAGTKGHYTCSVCKKNFDTDKNELADLTIKALGHDEVNHAGQAATCTADGWEAYVTCSRCDYTTFKKIDALGHDEVNHAGQAATCTEDGWEAYVTCSRCDYTTYHELPIDKTNHVGGEKVEGYKAPTYDDEGYTGDTYCLGCGDKLATGTTIPKLTRDLIRVTFSYKISAYDVKNVTVDVENGKTLTAAQIPTVETYKDGDYDVFFTAWDKDTTKAITEAVTFTAKTDRTFVKADYTGFNDAKADAEKLIADNDLTPEVIKKINDLIAAGYDNGEDYGRTNQDTVNNAASAVKNYINGLDRNGDGAVDDSFLNKYTVTFMVGSVAGATVQVKKGEDAKYPAEAKVALTKLPTAVEHYTFTGFIGGADGALSWTGDTVKNVTSDLTVYAVFVPEAHKGGSADCKNKAVCSVCSTAYGELGEHNYAAVPAQNATCTETGCTAHEKCTVCGNIRGNANETAALGHSVDFTKIYSSEVSEDGSYIWNTYKCVRCDYKEVIITIRAVDADGNPIAGATVEIGDQKGTTDENGEFTVKPLPDGEYNIKIEDTDNQLKGEGTVKVENGKVTGSFTGGSGYIHKYNCNNCLCHKNNIFGKILRWICTLLSVIFRRNIKCCSDMEWYGGLIKHLS